MSTTVQETTVQETTSATTMITVVLAPTTDEQRMARCVAALEAQTLPLGAFDVWVPQPGNTLDVIAGRYVVVVDATDSIGPRFLEGLLAAAASDRLVVAPPVELREGRMTPYDEARVEATLTTEPWGKAVHTDLARGWADRVEELVEPAFWRRVIESDTVAAVVAPGVRTAYLRDAAVVRDVEVRLPNFLLVGYPKTATTTLYDQLRSHPEVFLPEKKEQHFLNCVGVAEEQLARELAPFDAGVRALITTDPAAYRAQYAAAGDAVAIGDMTPSYALTPERTIAAAQRYLPGGRATKIIVLLRDPVEAAHSHWAMQTRHGIETLGFADAMAAHPERSARGTYRTDHVASFRYSAGVAAFLEAYDDVLVLLTEELAEHPQETLDRVHDFLGVARRAVARPDLRSNAGGERSALDPALAAELHRRWFAEDVERLEGLIGRSLAHWRR